jgi:hypothetical protein
MSLPLRISRTWLRLVGIGPALLLAALLPSYLAIDHWGEYAGSIKGHHEEAEEGSAEHASHGMHCHYGPSTCSDQPAPINGRVLPAAVELIEPRLAALWMDAPRVGVLLSVAFAPPTDPPWAAGA